MGSGEKDNVVDKLSDMQLAINAMAAGASKTAAQAAFNALRLAIAEANLVGPVRVGHEIPAAN